MSGEPIVRSSFHSVAKSHIAPVLLRRASDRLRRRW